MYFLIDYENVHTPGMRGTEYLLPSDHVLVFYSAPAPNMEAHYLTAIRDSACEESRKLRQMLEDAFEGTAFAVRTGKKEEILKSGKTPKVICLDTRRRYGRRDGLEVYKRLKSWAEF